MCFVLSVELRKWQHLEDAVNAAEYGTELTLGDFLALEFRFRLTAHPAVLLLDSFDIYFDPISFQTILINVTEGEDVLLGVEWESHVVGSDRDHSLSTVKSVVFVELDLLLPALIKLLLETFLVVYHVYYALIDITTVTRAAALEPVIIRCLAFVDQPVLPPDAACKTSGDHAMRRRPLTLGIWLFDPGVDHFVSSFFGLGIRFCLVVEGAIELVDEVLVCIVR